MTLTLSLITLTGPRNPGGPMSPFHPYGERQLQIMSTFVTSIYVFGILKKQNAQLNNKSMLKVMLFLCNTQTKL